MGYDTDRPAENERRSRRQPREAGPGDVLFDFTEVGSIDLPALSLILTARGLVPDEEGRRVWVAGLPAPFWSFLRSMGLEGYFEKFPARTPADA